LRVLDTDVCIELLRGNAQVIEHRRQVVDRVATTWITACELAYGAANSQHPEANHILVTEFLASLPILDCSLTAAGLFGENKARLRRAGNTVADADLMIAAVAQSHGAILVTGNTRHYARIEELHLEDWIRPSSAGSIP
jgi:tRNA(fMet)-specific endonuclease VapC